VDADRFHADGAVADLDALSNLPAAEPGTIRIGLVATMARWKGHAIFLRAVSSLSERLPIRAYVIGGALYKTNGSQADVAELKALAEQLGIGNRVGFTGYVSDSATVMRALDIVVHASTKPEPFGLVIAEAMAAGRPVIVSEAGGAAEILRLCSTGTGFMPGNVTALARRMEQLVDDPELRNSMAAKGPAAVRRHFGRQRLAEELIEIYRAVAPDPLEQSGLSGELFPKRESRAWGA
jgi:glycosyltransferase involved in cell wall biosynthesis